MNAVTNAPARPGGDCLHGVWAIGRPGPARDLVAREAWSTASWSAEVLQACLDTGDADETTTLAPLTLHYVATRYADLRLRCWITAETFAAALRRALDYGEAVARAGLYQMCPACGSWPRITPGTGPHFAALRCPDCPRHLRWLPRRPGVRR